MSLDSVGFLIHIFIEVPASFNFLLFPSRQLETTTPHAHAVIRQYAVLLFASVLVATVFVSRPMDDTSGKVAAALAIYHVAPSIRAANDLSRRSQLGKPFLASEACLYLFVHVVCCATLLHHFWTAVYTQGIP